ncbi:MAG: TetR/AcrR family transcriptional regulator [Alphaproteobacteria bacterium]|nr:TetR/AcrR family transcriptional regulator [Alphaproteobacteria bacterium]
MKSRSFEYSGDSKSISSIVTHLDHMRENRPSRKMSNGKSDKTYETIKNIIAAGREVFIRHGHAGLSLRKVAEEAGIAVGNLTYHFPTKLALLDAILIEAQADYAEAHLQQFEADRDSPLEILQNVMAFYVRDAHKSHGFFMQMWGYAASDEHGKETTLGLYRPLGRFIYYLVREANPKLNDEQIRQAVMQISSLEEGYKLFLGVGADYGISLQNAEILIRDITKRIVFPD